MHKERIAKVQEVCRIKIVNVVNIVCRYAILFGWLWTLSIFLKVQFFSSISVCDSFFRLFVFAIYRPHNAIIIIFPMENELEKSKAKTIQSVCISIYLAISIFIECIGEQAIIPLPMSQSNVKASQIIYFIREKMALQKKLIRAIYQ